MSELVPPADLREQLDALDKSAWANGEPITDYGRGFNDALDKALVVFAERERVLRSRIEALPIRYADSRNSVEMVERDDVLGVFDA